MLGRTTAYNSLNDAYKRQHQNTQQTSSPKRQPQPEPPIDLGEWDNGDDDEPIPPRGWLLGNLYCREFLSALLGDGASGKTALRIACALSLATGRPLIGEHVFDRCRVLLVCFEDSRDELRRRVKAAELHYKLTKADTKDYLFLAAVSRSDLKLAKQRRNGDTIPGKLGAALEETIVRRGVDLVILDPLIKTHGVQENDNNALDMVAEILSDIAARHHIAVDFPHHTRKGGQADPGNADIGRGASAVKDAGRLVYTLTKMTADEAAQFNVDDDERRLLIRMDSAKVNIAPPAKNAKWFKLIGVDVGNGTTLYPNGDKVQTVECWQPVDLWKIATASRANALLDTIDAGPQPGRRYTTHAKATDRAVSPAVKDAFPELNDTQCREIINTWLSGKQDRHFLKLDKYRDPVQREEQTGLFVIGRPG
jgi:hypothetical protein